MSYAAPMLPLSVHAAAPDGAGDPGRAGRVPGRARGPGAAARAAGGGVGRGAGTPRAAGGPGGRRRRRRRGAGRAAGRGGVRGGAVGRAGGRREPRPRRRRRRVRAAGGGAASPPPAPPRLAAAPPADALRLPDRIGPFRRPGPGGWALHTVPGAARRPPGRPGRTPGGPNGPANRSPRRPEPRRKAGRPGKRGEATRRGCGRPAAGLHRRPVRPVPRSSRPPRPPMNWPLLCRLLGFLGILVGGSMTLSLPWAFPACGQVEEFESRGFWALAGSVAIAVLVGGTLWWVGRKAGGDTILRKEALAVVGLGWIFAGVLGAPAAVPQRLLPAVFPRRAGPERPRDDGRRRLRERQRVLHHRGQRAGRTGGPPRGPAVRAVLAELHALAGRHGDHRAVRGDPGAARGRREGVDAAGGPRPDQRGGPPPACRSTP